MEKTGLTPCKVFLTQSENVRIMEKGEEAGGACSEKSKLSYFWKIRQKYVVNNY